jgi:hypothetical protein
MRRAYEDELMDRLSDPYWGQVEFVKYSLGLEESESNSEELEEAYIVRHKKVARLISKRDAPVDELDMSTYINHSLVLLSRDEQLKRLSDDDFMDLLTAFKNEIVNLIFPIAKPIEWLRWAKKHKFSLPQIYNNFSRSPRIQIDPRHENTLLNIINVLERFVVLDPSLIQDTVGGRKKSLTKNGKPNRSLVAELIEHETGIEAKTISIKLKIAAEARVPHRG